MDIVEGLVKAPRQERSRRSFDRALDAAVELVVEKGTFTLAEVAERGGISVGVIYGRVKSKDDLLRTAHAREMARLDSETAAAFADAAPPSETLAQAVPRIVSTTAELLRANAPVLRGFLRVADDDAIAATGTASYFRLMEAYTGALLAHRAEIDGDDPDDAVAWTFHVVFSMISRWLGLDSDSAAAFVGEWDDVVAKLTTTVHGYLRSSAR